MQSIRTHGVIQQANLNPLFGFFTEETQHGSTRLIRLENKILQMNVVSCRGKGFTNGFKSGAPLMIKTNVIARTNGKGAEPRSQSAHSFP